MSLTDDDRAELGTRLTEAYRRANPIEPFRGEYDLTVADGYAIQEEVLERRQTDDGRPVGYKIGFTNAAIQDELGVGEPAYGRILADTVRAGGAVDAGELIDPQVEAEIGFVLGEDLEGPTTVPAVLAATEAVVPVIEIVDSRIAEWDISAPEAVADNVLSGRVVHGDAVRTPTDLDLPLEGIRVLKNGAPEATGLGGDVLGNPANAVRWLAGKLADHGEQLRASDLVITGSATPLVPLERGDVLEVRFASLGSVTLRGT